MNHRILDVTASTTLDYVRAQAHGIDWVDDATAVVDVGTSNDAPPAVTLDFELDPTGLEHLDAHVETVRLSPKEARKLAAALEAAADDTDPATGD
ncbi:MAG: DUF6360 family protein [Halovenus sp.]